MGRAQSPESCVLPDLLQVLAHPWTMQILCALSHHGPLRFSELKMRVEGISSRVLTERLRQLAYRDLIFRRYEISIPPAVTYGMTKRARKLGKILHELEAVARKWKSVTPQRAGKRRPETI